MIILLVGILLFLIMDLLGNILFFLSLFKDVLLCCWCVVMVCELLIVLGVLLGFLVGG